MTNGFEILIFILPIAFAIHNLEEIFGMEKWTNSIPAYIHAPVTTRQFAIAVALFSVVGFVIIFTKNHFPSEEFYMKIISGFAGMLFSNVFFPHIIATIFLKKYAPGVISGILINLPLSSIILYSIFYHNLLTSKQILISVFIGGLSGIILAFIFLKVGKYFDHILINFTANNQNKRKCKYKN